MHIQTLLAVTEATKDNSKADYSKFLVLSLGTGSAKSDSGADVAQGLGWGLYD